MDDEVYDKYIFAGKIASDARDYGSSLIKPGVSFLEVAKDIETRIVNSGAELSFPVNISRNEVAAHYTPKNDDNQFFKKGDVVKLDVGSHFEGYIADTAITIEVETSKYNKMIKASSDALSNAINIIKPEISLSDIGKIIEDTILSYGYKPIDNLTGHSMERYKLHSGMSIPNISNASSRNRLKEGYVLAIEPFATDGTGHVVSGSGSNIYRCETSFRTRIIRDNKSKILYNKIKSEFKTLPFAQRWFDRLFPNNDSLLSKLSFLGFIKQYPQLIEKNKGIITQKEHTIIVTNEGCEVITYGKRDVK